MLTLYTDNLVGDCGGLLAIAGLVLFSYSYCSWRWFTALQRLRA